MVFKLQGGVVEDDGLVVVDQPCEGDQGFRVALDLAEQQRVFDEQPAVVLDYGTFQGLECAAVEEDIEVVEEDP